MNVFVWCLFVVLCVTGVKSYAVDFSGVRHQDQSEDTESQFINILMRIYNLMQSKNSPLPSQQKQSQFESLTQGIDRSHRSNRISQDKRGMGDMSVLPPWNEFCRMVGLTHCFHSQH